MKITIGKRLWAGFIVLIVLLAGVAGLSIYSGTHSSHAIQDLDGMMDNTAVGSRAQQAMLMVQMRVKDYLRMNRAEDVAGYEKWKATIEEQLAAAQAFTDPKRVEWINKIKKDFKEYDQAFAEVQHVIEQRNKLRDETIYPVGAALRKDIVSIRDHAYKAGHDAIGKTAATAAVELMLARYYAQDFLLTGNDESRARSADEFEIVKKSMEKARQDTNASEYEAELAQLEKDMQVFGDSLIQVKKYREQRDQLVHNTLDPMGAEIVTLWDSVADSLLKDAHSESDEAQTAAASAITVTFVVSLIATVVGLGFAWLIARSILKPTRDLISRMRDIAEGDGDLTQQVDVRGSDELATLGGLVNSFIKQIHDTISEVKQAATEVAAAATEISATSEELSTGVQEQSMQVTQVSSAVEEMSGSIQEVAGKATEAAGNSERCGGVANSGGQVVRQTIDGMRGINEAVSAGSQSVDELGRRGQQIGEVITVINDIADQTNLLALNAAIEAARAGEHGRGFAVVADEVRKLADRTVKATDEIAQSIEAVQVETKQAVSQMEQSTQRVDEGVGLAEQAGESLKQIEGDVDDLGQLIQQIAAAVEQQSAASQQVSQSMQSIDQITRQSNEAAQQAATAGTQLSQQAELLRDKVGRFQTRDV